MTAGDGDERARSTADAIARRGYGKLVAFLAARTRNVAAAEDALSEAFAAALADWPANGIPAMYTRLDGTPYTDIKLRKSED